MDVLLLLLFPLFTKLPLFPDSPAGAAVVPVGKIGNNQLPGPESPNRPESVSIISKPKGSLCILQQSAREMWHVLTRWCGCRHRWGLSHRWSGCLRPQGACGVLQEAPHTCRATWDAGRATAERQVARAYTVQLQIVT